MKKVILPLGVVLFALSLAVFVFYTTYTNRAITFTCDNKCNSSTDTTYKFKLKRISKYLSYEKTGTSEFYPYMNLSLKDDKSNYIETSKYNLPIKNKKIKLTRTEVRKFKEIIGLNKDVQGKYSTDILVLLLDMLYNDNNYCKNSIDCYNYYKNSDINHDNIVTYTEKGDYLLSKYSKYIKDNDTTSVRSKKFDLSEFKCKESNNSCTKTIYSIYNDKTNKIDIKYYYNLEHNSIPMYFTINLNGKKIDEFKNITYNLENESNKNEDLTVRNDALKDILNFGGYLLIIDNKYIAFMHYKYIDMNNSKLMLNVYGKNKIKDSLMLPNNLNLDEIEINKNSLYIWYPVCKSNNLTKLNLSVNQDSLEITPLKDKNNSLDKNLDIDEFGVCYDQTKNIIIEN